MDQRELSLGGNKSKAQGKVNWFDPVKGKVAAGGIKYTPFHDIGTGEVHWLPKGLKIWQVRTRQTIGFRPVPAHPNAGGTVWVPNSKR